jgi:response regulator RpfG family c-di-GMP phosphodiesterase
MTAAKKVPFLVVSSSPYMRGILKFVLESHLHTEVVELDSEEKALKFLKDIELQPSMIVYDYVPNAYLVEDFLGHLRDFSKSVRIIVLVDEVREESKSMIRDVRQMRLMKEGGLPKNLVEEAKLLFEGSTLENKDEFCRMDMNFLSILDGINKNLFIKIVDKYIKVFNEDDTTDDLDIQKYKSKGIDYFYLQRDTADWVLNQIQSQIEIFLKSNNFRFILRGGNDSPKKRFEQKILRISDEVHIDKEFRDSIDKVVDKIRTAVEKEPKVEAYLKALKEKQDLHSFFNHKMNLMSLMSCVLAKQLEWISKTTMDKLVYASVLCDITLAVRPELLAIKNLHEFEGAMANLSLEDQKIFLSHPKDAANLLKNYFKLAPPDTDQLVLQHHEMPDGQGFPLGLKAERISPLSALFIVTNDFAYYFLKDDEPSMDDFLLKCHSRYDFVNFRKVIQALVRARKR